MTCIYSMRILSLNVEKFQVGGGKRRSQGGSKEADEAVGWRADWVGPPGIGVSVGGGTDGAEGRGTNYACIAPWLCSFCLDVEKKTRVVDGSLAAGCPGSCQTYVATGQTTCSLCSGPSMHGPRFTGSY